MQPGPETPWADRALFSGNAIPVPADLPVFDDPAELMGMAVREIGLPAGMVNPMVMWTVLAHVRALSGKEYAIIRLR